MAQIQHPHPITKLSQLNKPTNHPKRKTRNKTSTLPTKTKSHTITINPKQNKSTTKHSTSQ